MKKLHLAFGVTAFAVLIVGLIHGSVAWMIAETTWEPFATSFPAWAAFVLPILYYAMGDLAILLAWLTAWLIVRGVSKKRLQKGNQNDILQL